VFKALKVILSIRTDMIFIQNGSSLHTTCWYLERNRFMFTTFDL